MHADNNFAYLAAVQDRLKNTTLKAGSFCQHPKNQSECKIASFDKDLQHFGTPETRDGHTEELAFLGEQIVDTGMSSVWSVEKNVGLLNMTI